MDNIVNLNYRVENDFVEQIGGGSINNDIRFRIEHDHIEMLGGSGKAVFSLTGDDQVGGAIDIRKLFEDFRAKDGGFHDPLDAHKLLESVGYNIIRKHAPVPAAGAAAANAQHTDLVEYTFESVKALANNDTNPPQQQRRISNFYNGGRIHDGFDRHYDGMHIGPQNNRLIDGLRHEKALQYYNTLSPLGRLSVIDYNDDIGNVAYFLQNAGAITNANAVVTNNAPANVAAAAFQQEVDLVNDFINLVKIANKFFYFNRYFEYPLRTEYRVPIKMDKCLMLSNMHCGLLLKRDFTKEQLVELFNQIIRLAKDLNMNFSNEQNILQRIEAFADDQSTLNNNARRNLGIDMVTVHRELNRQVLNNRSPFTLALPNGNAILVKMINKLISSLHHGNGNNQHHVNESVM